MPAPSPATRPVANFGGNVRFQPRAVYEPRNEDEVLEILRVHREGSIRVVGALHSWSAAVVSEDAVISLRHFRRVSVGDDAQGGRQVELGGGCRIKDALKALREQGDWTLPAIGLITEQTVAGAISTGTHGSGNHSLSHYARRIRLAAYCEHTGEPKVFTIDSGDDLRAARCSLGCLGVILSVTFPCRGEYHVGEISERYARIEDVLAREPEAPLQHFFLVPHQWRFVAQHRQVVEPLTGRLYRFDAWMYFAGWFLLVDVGFHALLKLLVLARARRLTRALLRGLPYLLLREKVFVGRSARVLTWEHHLFRHIEIEFFVRRAHVEPAALFVTEVLKVLDGTSQSPAPQVAAQLEQIGLSDRLATLRGGYSHHYPICVRRVLADDTLISMAAGDDDWYSFSLISLERSHDAFRRMADFVAVAAVRLFGARLHWGKYFPLDGRSAQQTYPQLARFAAVCRKYDPRGVFQNDFTRRILSEVQEPIQVAEAEAASR